MIAVVAERLSSALLPSSWRLGLQKRMYRDFKSPDCCTWASSPATRDTGRKARREVSSAQQISRYCMWSRN